MISNHINKIEAEYSRFEKEDRSLRQEHLRRFRPNLANPANANELEDLNNAATERTDKFLEKVDDTQMELLDFEMNKSNEFYVTYLNNLRCLIKLYECLVYKDHFIKLPGDEIVEKKALNIKVLTAKHYGHDLSFKSTRKWKGLDKNPFNVDLTQFDTFADFRGESEQKEEAEAQPPAKDA